MSRSSFSIAKPYANAAFEFAQKNNSLSGWGDWLRALSDIVRNQSAHKALISPELSSEQRCDFLFGLLVDMSKDKSRKKSSLQKPDQHIANFLRLIIANNRQLMLISIFEIYQDLLAELENQISVELYSVDSIDKAQVKILQQTLESNLAQKIHLENKLDPSLIAGFKIKIGDEVIDSSIKNRLKNLAYDLLS